MLAQYLLIFFVLSGFSLAAERQLGVEYTGIDVLENEEIQRDCGYDGPRSTNAVKKMIHGINVTTEELLREAKWVANTFIGTISCSGVLISRWHVLTGAHCAGVVRSSANCNYDTYNHNQQYSFTDVSQYKVRVYTRFGAREDTNAGRTYEVKRIIFPTSHPLGEGVGSDHYCRAYNNDIEDIAIYELKIPVALPTFVCLANVPLPFKRITNYGFGTTGLNDTLYHREPFILKRRDVSYDCKKWNKNNWPMPNDLNGQQCISSETTGCGGDSGSPVVARYYNRTFIVGVFVIGFDFPDYPKRMANMKKDRIPNWMTSVPHYVHWICKFSGICVYGADPLKDKRPTSIWDHTGEKKVL